MPRGQHLPAQVGKHNGDVGRTDVHTQDAKRVVLKFEYDGAPTTL